MSSWCLREAPRATDKVPDNPKSAYKLATQCMQLHKAGVVWRREAPCFGFVPVRIILRRTSSQSQATVLRHNLLLRTYCSVSTTQPEIISAFLQQHMHSDKYYIVLYRFKGMCLILIVGQYFMTGSVKGSICTVCPNQWRTQEFCSGGGFNKFS